MAWHLGGSWSGMPVKDLGHVLSNLYCAVNEREQQVGKTVSSWTSPPINQTFPPASKFSALSTKRVGEYLPQLRTAIESLASYSYSPGGSAVGTGYINPQTEDTWTLSALISAAGYGGSWITPTRAHQTAVWLQLREVIRLIRELRWPMIGISSGTRWRGQTGLTQTSQQQAYDTAKANIATSTWQGNPILSLEQRTTSNFATTLQPRNDLTFVSTMKGTPYKGVFGFYATGAWNASLTPSPMPAIYEILDANDDVLFEVKPHYWTSGAPGQDWMQTFSIEVGANWFTSDRTLSFKVVLPSSHPFGTMASNHIAGSHFSHALFNISGSPPPHYMFTVPDLTYA